jgi:predicted DCC family thiol-disulfide oxidoreductase YuxK
MAPIVLYDNRCYLCARFARIVNWLARRSLFLVGHYTELGEKLREEILDSSALEMFWFIDGKTAYGGRAALLPLLVAVLRKKPTGHIVPEEQKQCSVGCRTAKAVFVRSASLLTHSKKITIE